LIKAFLAPHRKIARKGVIPIRAEEKKTMKILVVYHSICGHVQTLAKAVSEGVQEVPGVELVQRRVHEFPEFVQHMEQEKGFSYQVYKGQQSIPECTVDDGVRGAMEQPTYLSDFSRKIGMI
jgi:multimeric flavodoxin WrbA